MIGLAYIMELEKISNKELAEKLGVKPPVVSYWLNLKNPIPAERLEQLSNLYPYYSTHYFTETITEKDKLTLENAKLRARLEALENVNSPQGVLIQRKMKKNLERMEEADIKILLDKLLRLAEKVNRDASYRNYAVSQNVSLSVNLVLSINTMMLEYLALKEIDSDVMRRDELKHRIKASSKELINTIKDSYGYLDFDR